MELLSRLFSSPRRQPEAAGDPVSSPLAKQHPNRIQKPHHAKGKAAAQKTEALSRRLASSLSRSSVLEELSHNGEAVTFQRGSRGDRGHDGVDYEAMGDVEQPPFGTSGNDDPFCHDHLEFASQPAFVRASSPEAELDSEGSAADDMCNNVVATTPNDCARKGPPIPIPNNQEPEYPPGHDEEGGLEEDGAEISASDEQEEEEEEEEEDRQYSFTRLLNYRWAGDEIEIEVQWHNSESTWEPETNLHADAPDALFQFWRARGGRPDNPCHPDLYTIFAIRRHEKSRKRLFVEWTGYPPSENCWVSRRVVEETAPEVVADYWRSLSRK